MMRRLTLSMSFALVLCAASTSQAASTLRCGSALISLGDTAADVLRKCGEPASRAFTGYVEAPGYNGRFNSLPVEEWVYGPNNGMYQYLRLQGNRLIDITSRRGD